MSGVWGLMGALGTIGEQFFDSKDDAARAARIYNLVNRMHENEIYEIAEPFPVTISRKFSRRKYRSGAILYGMKDEERLHDSLHDAVLYHLDQLDLERMPDTVEVWEYSRMRPRVRWSAAEYLLEDMDEEFGDPDGPTESGVTAGMREAEAALEAAVLKDYVPWACEPNGKIHVVNVADWVRENAPNWLEPARPCLESAAGDQDG